MLQRCPDSAFFQREDSHLAVDCLSWFSVPAVHSDQGGESPQPSGMDSRDQARRLPADCSARGRTRSSVHPQWPRLERAIPTDHRGCAAQSEHVVRDRWRGGAAGPLRHRSGPVPARLPGGWRGWFRNTATVMGGRNYGELWLCRILVKRRAIA